MVYNSNVVIVGMVVLLMLIGTVTSCPWYPRPVPVNQQLPILQDVYAKVEQMIRNYMDIYQIPSFVGVIVYGDTVVYEMAIGLTNPTNLTSPPMSVDNTLVRIASVTKVFTDLMLFQARDDGLVTLDTPITDLIEEYSVLNPYNTKRPITLRQLASHQSGLPRNVPCNDIDLMNDTLCSEDVILGRVSQQYLVVPQYSTTHYSNLGVAILGHGLERAVNDKYESYIQHNILDPLNMYSSTFNLTLAMYGGPNNTNVLATGVNVLPNGTYSEVEPLGIGWANPAGGLISTARDMSKFISFWLNGGDLLISGSEEEEGGEGIDYSLILDPSTVNEAMEPLSMINDGSSAYGTPFEFHYNNDTDIWLHGKLGIQDGFRSHIAMARPFKLGVFFSIPMNFNTYDVFTYEALQLLLPVYQYVLLQQEQHQSVLEKEYAYSNNSSNQPIGLYSLESSGLLLSVYNDTHGNLFANFGSNPQYKLEPFTHSNNSNIGQQPLIKRMKVLGVSSETCKNIVDGADDELIYFTPSSNGLEYSSVLVLGQMLPFISNNPNPN